MTLPFLLRAAKTHVAWVAVLVVIGICMGLLATTKSELEAGILEQVASLVSDGRDGLDWTQPLSRFASEQGQGQGRSEHLIQEILRGTDLRTAVLMYAGIAALGAFLAVLGARGQAASTLHLA